MFEFISKFAPSFSTKSSKSRFDDRFISRLDEKMKIEILRTFWCDEGSISKNGKIVGKSKSLKLIKQLKNLHDSLGIETTIWIDRKSKNYALYIKKNKYNILRFSAIGFGNGIVTRGSFIGLKKNEVFNKLYGPVISLTPRRNR